MTLDPFAVKSVNSFGTRSADMDDAIVHGISTLATTPSTSLPIKRDIATAIGIEPNQNSQSSHPVFLKIYRGVASNRAA